MANNKEPINYTNRNQQDKLLNAHFEKKITISQIEDEELELNAKNQKNQSDKQANDDISQLQYNKEKFEALVTHISKIKELKNDYYSLIKKDDKKSFLDKWFEREKLIAQNINEANNKILTLNNNLNINLDINKVKQKSSRKRSYRFFKKFNKNR